jgi:hypothetical protein
MLNNIPGMLFHSNATPATVLIKNFAFFHKMLITEKMCRQSLSERNRARAIGAMGNKKISSVTTAVTFSVPHDTLRRQWERGGERKPQVQVKNGSTRPTFVQMQKINYTTHFRFQNFVLFGLADRQILQFSFDVSETTRTEHRQNEHERIAGWDWLIGFRKRSRDFSPSALTNFFSP